MPTRAEYARFTEYLLTVPGEAVTLSFERIERIIGAHLPPTAYDWEPFWSNSPSHPLAKAWRDAGWSGVGVAPLLLTPRN